MEKTIRETAKEIQARVEAKGNPYANGKGRAIMERLIQEKKQEQENAIREYQQNPEIRKMYDRLEQKTIVKENHGK
jgi:hypothetical protein